MHILDLNNLCRKERLKGYLFFQEGKKVKSSSGFTGKGFKFDEAEAQLSSERKKFQRAAHGLQDSDDEDAEADVSVNVFLTHIKQLHTLSVSDY